MLGRARLYVSPDGALGAVAQPDNELHVWDLRAEALLGVLAGHWGDLTAGALGPGGRLVTAALDGTVRLWDAGALTQTHQLDVASGEARAVALGDDGEVSLLLDTGDLWTWRPGLSPRRAEEATGPVDAAVLLPSGPLRLRRGAVTGPDGAVLLDGVPRGPARMVADGARLAVVTGRAVLAPGFRLGLEARCAALRSDALLVAVGDAVHALDERGEGSRVARADGSHWAETLVITDLVCISGHTFARGRAGQLGRLEGDRVRWLASDGPRHAPAPRVANVSRLRLEEPAAPPAPIVFRPVAVSEAASPAHTPPTRSSALARLDAVRPALARVRDELRGGRGYREAGLTAVLHTSGLELDVAAGERVLHLRVGHDGRFYRVELVASPRPDLEPPPETTLVRLASLFARRGAPSDGWVPEVFGDEPHDVRVRRAGGALSVVVTLRALPSAATLRRWLVALLERA